MANRFSRQVTRGVRIDDKNFYEALAQQQGEIAADEGLPSFWKSIKPLLPKSRKKQRSNIRCTGPEPHELCAHYNQLEAGFPCDYSSLLLQCFHRQKMAAADAPLQMALSDLPSRQEIEQAGHRLKKGGRLPLGLGWQIYEGALATHAGEPAYAQPFVPGDADRPLWWWLADGASGPTQVG